MKVSRLFVLAILMMAPAYPAFGHNGLRIHLTVEDNKLITNQDLFANGHNITQHVRVFQGNFGKDAENPADFFTQFPGLSPLAIAPNALTAGTSIGFNILDALKYWDGAGEPSFGPTLGETISISKGVDIVTTAGGAVAGYTLIASVTGTDGQHTHPGYTLNDDGFGVRHDGVYLLELNMTNDNRATEPYWIVFGQNVEASTVQAAAAFINATEVPEPASLGLLAIGAAGFLLRPRRR